MPLRVQGSVGSRIFRTLHDLLNDLAIGAIETGGERITDMSVEGSALSVFGSQSTLTRTLICSRTNNPCLSGYPPHPLNEAGTLARPRFLGHLKVAG